MHAAPHAPEPETIDRAAIRHAGRVYAVAGKGADHLDVCEAMIAAGRMDASAELEQGYATTAGRFVTCDDADVT
jgi:hypothetical protein